MGTALSPIVSEFETAEQEASYNEWLRAKVAASLSDPRPVIPHDEVMAEIDELINQIAAGKESS
ncbi:antitoxin [Salmonella enterica subsp. enterica serovar Enteritidis]|nr:antitoxin [Salmonella enterica subsp. enterica serovar Gombe]ECK2143409.1 antitoxin [Salmonella enterica subsp. enterica serovar Enteritidis]HDC2546808.1 antitoxin [Salmonella enterica]HDC2561793.1 antitoxin [Salmonella enterica]